MKRQSTSSSASEPKAKKPFWLKGLYESMEKESLQVYKDEQVVAIKDVYPKAKHHFLVLPLNKLEGIQKLSKEHVPLLEYMEKIGRQIAATHSKETDFRFGYHSIPSMPPLHLHVISQDFESSYLKTKKHWNSFNSDYFKDSQDVISLLKETGTVSYNKQIHSEMLKEPLRCHKCEKCLRTIPKLKEHIKVCKG